MKIALLWPLILAYPVCFPSHHFLTVHSGFTFMNRIKSALIVSSICGGEILPDLLSFSLPHLPHHCTNYTPYPFRQTRLFYSSKQHPHLSNFKQQKLWCFCSCYRSIVGWLEILIHVILIWIPGQEGSTIWKLTSFCGRGKQEHGE